MLWKISGCTPALKHYSFCKAFHLKCLTVFWRHLFLDNCSVMFTVILCCFASDSLKNSGIFRTLFIQLFAGNFKHTQRCEAHSCTASDTLKNSGIFRLCLFSCMQAFSSILSVMKHINAYWSIFRLIQAYSGACVTLAYSQPCHILNPGIFRTGGTFKTLPNFD